jgi:hypothetical protein
MKINEKSESMILTYNFGYDIFSFDELRVIKKFRFDLHHEI